ncbi:aquaporin-7-like [Babylonia areolata]|uniref:aquaporin-7-like n=1 Tax=Babylonia areolata TaxID=304850 RepID=UPI003FD40FE1
MAGRCSLKHHTLVREFFAEMLGTFILMIFGIGSVAQTVLSEGADGSAISIRWSWGFGVALGVSASVGVTGGHINPSVSVAMATLGRLPWLKVPLYLLGQYVGSFLASVVVYLVYMDALDHYDGGHRQVEGVNATASIWSTYPKPYVSTWTGLGDQIFGTAILLVCVMALTDSRHSTGPAPSSLTPFFIGAVVVVIGMTFGLNCGYAINPARDLSPRIFTALAGWGAAPFSFRDYNWFWVPVLGPHVGALLGAHLYQFLVGLHWPDLSPAGPDPLTLTTVDHSPPQTAEGGKHNLAADVEVVEPAEQITSKPEPSQTDTQARKTPVSPHPADTPSSVDTAL